MRTERDHTAAVVLNYRTPEESRRAVRSLFDSQQVPAHVIVVDNDHAPVPDAAWARPDKMVTCVATGRNTGFSGGMNAGIRVALGQGAGRVLLVNSDATLAPDAIGGLEHALRATPSAGIAGPVILARAEPGRVLSRGISFNASTGRVRLDGFGGRLDEGPSLAVDVVDAVSGCVALIDRRVFDAIGLFDEDYFFSFEDIDFGLRARRAGFLSVVARQARALHDGGLSIGPDSPQRLYYAARNHLLLGHRHNPSAGFVESRCRDVSIVGLNAAHAARAAGGGLSSRLAAVARGVSDYARGRFGAA